MGRRGAGTIPKTRNPATRRTPPPSRRSERLQSPPGATVSSTRDSGAALAGVSEAEPVEVGAVHGARAWTRGTAVAALGHREHLQTATVRDQRRGSRIPNLFGDTSSAAPSAHPPTGRPLKTAAATPRRSCASSRRPDGTDRSRLSYSRRPAPTPVPPDRARGRRASLAGWGFHRGRTRVASVRAPSCPTRTTSSRRARGREHPDPSGAIQSAGRPTASHALRASRVSEHSREQPMGYIQRHRALGDDRDAPASYCQHNAGCASL